MTYKEDFISTNRYLTYAPSKNTAITDAANFATFQTTVESALAEIAETLGGIDDAIDGLDERVTALEEAAESGGSDAEGGGSEG